jgi:hypothetical protein
LKRTGSLILVFLVVPVLLGPAAARAQDPYTYTLSALGGLGGAVEDSEGGVGNTSFSLGLSLLREDRVHIGARLGQIDFDAGNTVGELDNATLSYLLAGADYRFLESFYESGLFFGLGAYELEGDDLLAEPESESGVGFVLGVTGEFEINRRFGFIVEILGHVTTLEQSGSFVTGQVGLAAHF